MAMSSTSRCASPHRTDTAPRDDNGDMDAPSPTPERSRELADLRQRAYGPGADIDRDPDAVRRLGELEALAREQPEPTAAPEPAREEQPTRPRLGVPAENVDEPAPAAS